MITESSKNRRFICLTDKREGTSLWIDDDTIFTVIEIAGGSTVVYIEQAHKFVVDVKQLHGNIIAAITSPRIIPKRNIRSIEPLSALNPVHYDEDGVMIGHAVVPMDEPSEGVFWCRICGGHPNDPIHQPGWKP